MDVPHYWTADQVGRLLDTLADHKRHQARALALIMSRTGLRVSEALALECRDLDYRSEVPTLLVRESKSDRPRTVPLHDELAQLFTNWPAPHRSRDRVVPLNVVSSWLGHANVQVTLRVYLPIAGSTYSMADVP